jgi:hypothetical protein
LQVIDRQCALPAARQMIGDGLKLLAGQVSVNIQRRLFRGQVRAQRGRRKNVCRLAEDFGTHGEERRVAVQRAFGLPPARFTLGQVIRHRQQFPGA